MKPPRLVSRPLTTREVANRRRRRGDLQETADTAVYVAIRAALVVLALAFAGDAVYRMVVHGAPRSFEVGGLLLLLLKMVLVKDHIAARVAGRR